MQCAKINQENCDVIYNNKPFSKNKNATGTGASMVHSSDYWVAQ